MNFVTAAGGVKKKWKYLSDKFKQTKKKKPTGSEADDEKWPYFEDMTWFEEFIAERERLININ